MKFAFLTNLFTKKQAKSASTNQEPIIIPEQEINDVFQTAIDEAMDSVITGETHKEDIEQELLVSEPTIKPNTLFDILNFEIIQEMNGCRFEVNKEHGICKIYWNGTVDIETARKLVTLGADSVEFNNYKKLVLDRSDLVEFDTEARVWIKGLLKTRAKRIVSLVEKMAVIKAKTTKGSIFSNFITAAISIVMPNLQMKKFDVLAEAISWLKND